ncbi:helix-turn-helix domain-containing protein [Enterobacter mori]|uniref:helix-turn-helix domain-containing protein n=1 Tax=Enterobacter mori TaxID=539813 RepID=UPI001B8C0DE4|nr:helix-turn-helix transcriptional regulator [Enterobacter mori]MBS3045964.1 hypothetical protein [Enterobacter mori]
MLNIIIPDFDGFFSLGLRIFIQDFICETDYRTVNFLSEFSEANVASADLIFIELASGEKYLCHELFKVRKKHSMLIGVNDADGGKVFRSLPLCFKGMIFISHKIKIEKIKIILNSFIASVSGEISFQGCYSCGPCQYRAFSRQQLNIAAGLYRGESVSDIAAGLNISPKTVSAHKRIMMTKFDLNTNQELHLLLDRMWDHSSGMG